MLRRMKINCVINTGKIVNRFGNALLIKQSDGKHELVGGTDRDFTEAKEWVSLFAHEIVFSRLRRNRIRLLHPKSTEHGHGMKLLNKLDRTFAVYHAVGVF